MDDKAKEDLGIYLAKNREEVLYALFAKKRPTPDPKAANDEVEVEEKPAPKKRKAAAKS
jgi:dsDNA-binding SOS-regulon protein